MLIRAEPASPARSTPGFGGFVCSVKEPIAWSTFSEVSSVHHVVTYVCGTGSNQKRARLRQKQIKKDHGAYSSTRQITTEPNIRRGADLEVLSYVSRPGSEKAALEPEVPPTGVDPLNSTNGYMFPRIAREE